MQARWGWLVGLGSVGSLVAACGGSTVLHAEDYDQSCTADGDCVVVKVGDICCGCSFAGINQEDFDDYQDDRGECSSVCDIGCMANEAFCEAGTCQVRDVGAGR